MKKILDQIPQSTDSTFRQFAFSAGKSANLLRWFYCLMFAVSSLWSLNDNAPTIFIYPVLTVLWLTVAMLFGYFHKSDVFILSIWIDLAIITTGLLLCAVFGVFNAKGFNIFLCYFPVMAIATRRYNLLFVLQIGAGLLAMYAVLSLWTLQTLPIPRLFALAAMTLVCAALAKKPKAEVVEMTRTAVMEAYALGAHEKEVELLAVMHKQFYPPAQYELPGLYASYKHGVGTDTSGDFYYALETRQGPLVVLGDLPGKGLDAALAATQLQQFISETAQEKEKLSEILMELNAVMWAKKQTVSCILARWEGTNLHYVNAGHLPAIRISKREPELLPVNAPAVGAAETIDFAEAVLEFPKGDLLLLYTDGAYAGLAQEQQAGIAEMMRLAEQFGNGEVNTICHRVFDCGQPEYKKAPDDSTVVIVRRQEYAAEAKG
ncbi:MAG: serine/threonine-protein phosphatase [Acidobacteria bacterium]|nr:serine/threonine-protein phosphatase [Acidobacteriota bacterium]